MVHFIFLDIISLNKSKFCEYVDSIYPIQFEIKESTDTDTSASYLNTHLEINNESPLKQN